MIDQRFLLAAVKFLKEDGKKNPLETMEFEGKTFTRLELAMMIESRVAPFKPVVLEA